MQRILVIDDDPAVTSVLKRGLSYEGFAVATATSGQEGLALERQRPSDLVVLDIMMPGLNGLEVLQRLRAADEHLPVILLTARDAPVDQIHGLESGADDYVCKPFHFDILLARIRSLLRRQLTDHPVILHFADLTLDPTSHTVQRGQRAISLTSLEFKLLQEFLLHPQQVLSKDVLLERVWEYEFNDNVVEVYVKQLRQKLEAQGEPRLLQTLSNVGYVLREEM
ncbi:MAG TPA: response regulator transcription factor [Ktedonobacteraceae bacterium]|nr:response regulator transcription factor [Ktedonobacteraceae bacterium]